MTLCGTSRTRAGGSLAALRCVRRRCRSLPWFGSRSGGRRFVAPLRARSRRRGFTFRKQPAEHAAYRYHVAFLRRIGREAEDAAVDRLDFLDRLVALEREERLPFLDAFARPLEPCEESSFLHGPAESRQFDLDGHGDRPFTPRMNRE